MHAEGSKNMYTQKDQMEEKYLISETARLVGVESHVLRYWEEELKLPIRRNELGHRYYTREDVEQFREIKKMKEQGLQLKAIRTVLMDSSMQVMVPLQSREIAGEEGQISSEPAEGDKGARLQMLLHNLISQAVRENNKEMTQEIKETILKELDYQFRVQDEENRKRDQERMDREEEHFRQLDEKLREYSRKKPGIWDRRKKEAKKEAPGMRAAADKKGLVPMFGKRKKHSPM